MLSGILRGPKRFQSNAGAMHPATRTAIFRRLKARIPTPTTELLHGLPFELLVAVMLSAHTTDKSVNAATRVLFPVANTPAGDRSPRGGGREGVHPHRGPLQHQGEEPDRPVPAADRPARRRRCLRTRALEALPGVGRKTASIILNMVFGESRDRGRHAHLPRRQPHRACARARTRARSRMHWCATPRPSTARTRTTGCCCTAATCAPRAPRLPHLPDPRPVRVPAQDPSQGRACEEEEPRRAVRKAAQAAPGPDGSRGCRSLQARGASSCAAGILMRGASSARRPHLSPWSAQLAAVIAEHPEYIGWLESGDAALGAEFTPEGGRENPFLHMGLHLAIREQVATDRPAGIAQIHERLAQRAGGAHAGRAPHDRAARRDPVGSAAQRACTR